MPCVCLVCAADFDEADFMRRYKAGAFGYIVAVDGGYSHLSRIGVVPDYAVGDWDSLGFVPQDVPCETHPSIKDATDLELALDYAREQQASELFAYGCLSGRLDHTVAALQTLALIAEEGVAVTGLVGDGSALRVLVGPDELGIPAGQLGTVSVFAANDLARGVTETGMMYELFGEDLPNRGSLGVSNELVCQPATIFVQAGTLYVFLPATCV